MALLIAGAGGVGREALDVALACGRSVEAFVDEHPRAPSCRGLPVLGLDDALGRGDAEFLVAIGDPGVRRRLAGVLAGGGLRPASLVHPAALIAPETHVGPGALIMAGAYLSSGIEVGAHVQVHYHATVGHDTRLEDYATVLPGANVAGTVSVGEGATIGSAACVLQGRSVGRGATVGAGAVVTADVAPGDVVVGVPARPHR